MATEELTAVEMNRVERLILDAEVGRARSVILDARTARALYDGAKEWAEFSADDAEELRDRVCSLKTRVLELEQEARKAKAPATAAVA